MACPLGNSQSLESQSGLYSAIRNRLTTQSKPDLRYHTITFFLNNVLAVFGDGAGRRVELSRSSSLSQHREDTALDTLTQLQKKGKDGRPDNNPCALL